MQSLDLQLLKVLLLAVLATALGFAVLELQAGDRRAAATATAASTATGADAPAAAAARTPEPATLAREAAAPGELVADAGETAVPPAGQEQPTSPPPPVERRGGVECGSPHRLVVVRRDVAIRARPGGPTVGTLPAASPYLGNATTAWVQAVSADGRWGKVTIPWSKPVTRTGWVPLAGMGSGSTRTMVVADLSERQVRVYRGCDELFAVQTAIGRPGSPSPRGRFWVSERIAVPTAQQDSFGTYAFGMSTVQPNLPPGWTGGDQMAIHGTGAPGSIGEAASAGCLRVSEAALARLKPLLRVGTPVIIQA